MMGIECLKYFVVDHSIRNIKYVVEAGLISDKPIWRSSEIR